LQIEVLYDIKIAMKISKPLTAATELLLVFPAALFITALFVRDLQPLQYEPARTAQRIVDWCAASPHVGLWLLLIALPLIVFAGGYVWLLGSWKTEAELRDAGRQTVASVRAHVATVVVAIATLAAGGILAIVALHLIAD
jgi:hypothetical protein